MVNSTMKYVILDACVLGEFFSQYFSSCHADRGHGYFVRSSKFSREATRVLNSVLIAHRSEDQFPTTKVVITPLGMIELCRKWKDIVSDPLLELRVKALIEHLPDWIVIASWDETILSAFIQLPDSVNIDGESKPIEWTDAVYPATAISYGRGNIVISTDRRIKALADQSDSIFTCV